MPERVCGRMVFWSWLHWRCRRQVLASPFISLLYSFHAVLPFREIILTAFTTTGGMSGDIGVGGCTVTSALASSVLYEYSNNNGGGCMWASADGQTCGDLAIDQASCTCPSADGCQNVDPGDLTNVMAWIYDSQGVGTSSCIVPGEGP